MTKKVKAKINKLARMAGQCEKLFNEIKSETKNNDASVIGYSVMEGHFRLHINNGIKELGVPVTRVERNSKDFPYEDVAMLDGMEVFQLLSQGEVSA